ncbi:hypothetical protein Tco_1329244 [Tanacetum coccineum]
MPWSCKVRVGSNGNLLWEASVLLGRKKGGCVMDTLKFTAMPFGLTNASAVFIELRACVKMYRGFFEGREDVREGFKKLEVEQRGSILMWKDQLWEKVIAYTSRQLKVLMNGCMTNVDHGMSPTHFIGRIGHEAKMMDGCYLLTNRWLSMKKDIASCGSKYLAYLEVEVEYQGSSRLLLQPELPE